MHRDHVVAFAFTLGVAVGFLVAPLVIVGRDLRGRTMIGDPPNHQAPAARGSVNVRSRRPAPYAT